MTVEIAFPPKVQDISTSWRRGEPFDGSAAWSFSPYQHAWRAV